MSRITYLVLLLCLQLQSIAQTADFVLPDTVCINTPVQITNTSTGGSTWYWNFCSGGLYNTPAIANMGNVSNALDLPSFNAVVKDGDDYYQFITNNSGTLVRYAYGKSLINTPVVRNMGSFGGLIPGSTEGVAVENDGTGWYVFVAGGYFGNSRLVKIKFGNSLANNPTVATNVGLPAGMDFPHEFNLIKEGNNWYGFIAAFNSNDVGRYDFGTSLDNAPAIINFGTIGGFNVPTGLTLIQQGGNWHLFVVNEGSNSITRVDLGANIANNTPTAVNLGANPKFNKPRDIAIFRDCGQIFGLVGAAAPPYMLRVDFGSDVTNPMITSEIDVTGAGFSFANAIAQIRVGDTLFLMVTNVFNNTITRFIYSSCTDASIPSSQAATPPSFSYSKAGTYNVSLVMNEGLPTQRNICKTIVVVPPPTVALGADVSVCEGRSVPLDAGTGTNYRYLWNTGATTRTLNVTTSGTYKAEVFNGGCTVDDEIDVNFTPSITLNTTIQPIDCKHATGTIDVSITGGAGPFQYTLNGAIQGTNASYTNLTANTYQIAVQDAMGCTGRTQAVVAIDPAAILEAQAMVLQPACAGQTTGAVTIQVNAGVPPFEYSINNSAYQASPNFSNLAQGTYIVSVRNNVCDLTINTRLTDPQPLTVTKTVTDDACGKAQGSVAFTTTGGTPPYQLNWNNTPAVSPLNALSEGTYVARITDAHNCGFTETVTVNNIVTPPVTILNNDTTINLGDRITLHAVNAVDYRWSPAEGLSCTDCASPVAMPLKTITYRVVTLTGLNCINTDQVTINVIPSKNVHFPNAFSPNNDGANDSFKPKASGVEKYILRIFNRWGQLLFQTTDPSTGWNGRYKGQPQDIGTYVYMAEYKFYGQEDVFQKKGTFVLVR